jgi:hypothetical protein
MQGLVSFLRPSDIERFHSSYVIAENGCHEWIKHIDQGYGTFNSCYNRRPYFYRAHRLSWELANEYVPIGLCVLHKCDNPRCVNPDHLFLGTKKDNMDDMDRKGHRLTGAGRYVRQKGIKRTRNKWRFVDALVVSHK